MHRADSAAVILFQEHATPLQREVLMLLEHFRACHLLQHFFGKSAERFASAVRPVGNQLSSVPQVLANHTLHSAPNDLGLPSNLTESEVLAVEMYDSLLLEQCELSFHDLLHKIRDTAINNLLLPMISKQELEGVCKNKRDLWCACERNGYFMPDIKSQIVTFNFLSDVRFGTCFVP